jgi:23S rRNA G2445 N2-methylase RlmL
MPPAGTRVDRLRLLGVQGSSKVMAGELSRLAGRALEGETLARFRAQSPFKLGSGGLAYGFEPQLATVALLYHRTSARVLWDLYETDATRLEPLYDALVEAVAADDRNWLWDGARISVLAFAPRSVAAGERQVVGTVKNALVEGALRRGVRLEVDPERPDVTFHARSHVDQKGTPQLTVSIDLAGRPKHERGYRTRAGEAPLREDVAAYLVMLTRHDARSEALIDPCAGAGTLAVEAASMARARVAWSSGRRVAAEKLPAFAGRFEAPRRALFADTRPLVFANERDPRVFGLLQRAVETAGVGPDVIASCGDFRDLDPRALLRQTKARGLTGGVVLCNPPWGERMGQSRELVQLYKDLGSWCRELPGWRAGILAAHPEFERVFGARPRSTRPVMSGPLRATFFLFDL